MTTIEASRRDGAAMREKSYGAMAIAFHWISAFFILAVGIEAFFIDDFPRSQRFLATNIHTSVGFVALVLIVGRLWWRSQNKPPELSTAHGETTRKLSHAVHMLLYVLMVVSPLIGLVAIFARGRGIDFGLFSIPSPMGADRTIGRASEQYHRWVSFVLFGLAGFHILAALWHQFWLRDGVLARMIPALQKGR